MIFKGPRTTGTRRREWTDIYGVSILNFHYIYTNVAVIIMVFTWL